MIDYLTHYYRKNTLPFRSLSALSDDEAQQIMAGLYLAGSVLWERFKDPAWYLQARRQVEAWLRASFLAKGGRPRDPYPLYLVLGQSGWFLKMADAATLALTAEIRVPLSIFDETEVSFTYPDSMVSTLLAYEKNPAYYQPEYHGQLFTLSEIRPLVEANGLPEEGWTTNMPGFLAHYIEAQVWNRAALLDHLGIYDF